jgi:MFS family permease
VNDLGGSSDFVWIGSAYTLASTALVPFTGGIAEVGLVLALIQASSDYAQIFGRRPVVLMALAVFAAGSAVCGAASSMNMLIAGRGLFGDMRRGHGISRLCSHPRRWRW